MNRNKPKSLVDVANDIADLVRNSKVMLTFREKDQTWYNMYQQKEQQWKDYNEQRQKLQENMIFKDPEFRNLCDEEEKLSQEKTAVKKEMDAIGKKQAEGKNLSKKEKRELENLTGKFNGLENNLNNVEKKRNERYACLEKPYEQAAAKIKIPDGPNPRNWLSLPEFYTTANDANIAYVFGMDNNSRITQLKVKNSDLDVTLQAALVEEIQAPYDDVLGPLTRYVRLTILYDKILSSSTVEGISKGIWPKDESFAEVFWEELQAGWEYSEEIRGIINEDIQNVKKELGFKGVIVLNLAEWNKNDDYNLVLAIVGDEHRAGVDIKNHRQFNTIKERLKKATKNTGDDSYVKFANTLHLNKKGQIYTKRSWGMVSVKQKYKKK